MRYKREFLIYGLRDPRSGEIRYVGQSSTGLLRPRSHLLPSNLSRNTNNIRLWLKSLVEAGIKPEIVILERLEEPNLLDETEKWWIAIGRQALGVRFLNIMDGGSVVRKNVTQAVRGRQSQAKRAAWQDPAFRERIIAAQNKGKSDPMFRAAVSATITALHRSADVRAAIGEKTKEAWKDPAKRQRMLDAKNAVFRSPEYRARRHVVAIEVFNRPETKAKKRATMERLGYWRPR